MLKLISAKPVVRPACADCAYEEDMRDVLRLLKRMHIGACREADLLREQVSLLRRIRALTTPRKDLPR